MLLYIFIYAIPIGVLIIQYIMENLTLCHLNLNKLIYYIFIHILNTHM